MNKKLNIFLALFVMLGFFCFIKVNATTLDLSNLQTDSSCSLQNIQGCDRNGLIMILIQLILQMSADSNSGFNDTLEFKFKDIEKNLPDLYLYSNTPDYIESWGGKESIIVTVSNKGASFDMCEHKLEVLVTNLENQKTITKESSQNACQNSTSNAAGYSFGGNNTYRVEFGFPISDLGIEYNEYAKIKIVLDPNNRLDEINKNNNSLTTYVGTKPASKNYSKFAATEVVNDNLPSDITFWSSAYCPNQGYRNYVYTVPEGYELVSCEMGGVGTHRGCSYCAMAKIKLKVKSATTSSNSYLKIKNTSFNNLCKGDTFKIAWETDYDKVTVGYERKNISGHFASLGEYDKNITSINWKAGTDLKGNYFNVANGEEEIRLKIIARNNDITRYVYSEFFKLTDCSNSAIPSEIEKKVLYPSLNAELCKGEETIIKWQAEKNTSYYMQLISEKEASAWAIGYNVKTNADGLGEYAWKAENPSTNSNKYKITFESQDSSNRHTIVSDYITVNNCEEVIACIDLYDPVCGVDGKTYSNECVATRQAKVQVAHKGACSNSTSSGSLSRPIPCGKYGDINGDGKITYVDVEEGYKKIDNANVDLSVIDVDGNGEAGYNDVVKINEYLTGKTNTFFVCSIVSDISASLEEKVNSFGNITNWIRNIFK